MESKRQKKKEAQKRLMAILLAGLMVFSAIAGVLAYLLA